MIEVIERRRREKIGSDHPDTVESMHTLQEWQDGK